MKRTLTLLLWLIFSSTLLNGQEIGRALELIDLQNPNLSEVRTAVERGDSIGAMQELLSYYRSRDNVVCPDLDLQSIELSDEHRRWADEAMEHRFFVHTGYQPSFFYGEDIDWEYWPVKDNELRWQLHRTKWWVPMGKAYRLTGDEKYAKEWRLQYLDWIKKNPLENYVNPEKGPGEGSIDLMTAENVQFAWRPLEVSDRVEFQIHQFLLFLDSPSFDAEFLAEFLLNYHRHCKHLKENFSAQGNHRIFQAQRLLYGAIFFPELKQSKEWRDATIEILNQEIERQVYHDGMQFELDPHYHLEAINIFFNALRMCHANNLTDVFPKSYIDRVERMITVNFNYSFPDYTNPMFSDAKLHEREYTLPYYKRWAEVYTDNPMILYMASEGTKGATPSYLSKAFPESGFYTLRNGWDMGATVLSLKAGPPAFWHCQPDNGTFELWVKGRNFFPDSGSYVYGGDSEINRLREWFRQTREHNTLTLNGKNLENTNSLCSLFTSVDSTDIVRVENDSYQGLHHRRTIHFVKGKFFVIIDEASGNRRGDVELNYHLLECSPKIDWWEHSAKTRFKDGNNLLIRVWGAERMEMSCDKGRVSRTYREYNERPSLRFKVEKNSDKTVRFVTLIMPFEGKHAPQSSVKIIESTLCIKAGDELYTIDLRDYSNN